MGPILLAAIFLGTGWVHAALRLSFDYRTHHTIHNWQTFYRDQGSQYFHRLAQSVGPYAPLMGKILEEQGLPRQLLFMAIIESNFRHHAQSEALAMGPWQFMPATARRFGLKINSYVDERRDPIKSTLAAAKYLHTLHREFGQWELALAAYNMGEGQLRKKLKSHGRDFWQLLERQALPEETRRYVPKILALLRAMPPNLDFPQGIEFHAMMVGPKTPLQKIAMTLNTSLSLIKQLNPELQGTMTPPQQSYLLRIPPAVTANRQGFITWN